MRRTWCWSLSQIHHSLLMFQEQSSLCLSGAGMVQCFTTVSSSVQPLKEWLDNTALNLAYFLFFLPECCHFVNIECVSNLGCPWPKSVQRNTWCRGSAFWSSDHCWKPNEIDESFDPGHQTLIQCSNIYATFWIFGTVEDGFEPQLPHCYSKALITTLTVMHSSGSYYSYTSFSCKMHCS